MDYLAWIGAIGGLLLLTSLLSGWIHDTPITHFAIYLLAGMAVGPWGLGLVYIDLRGHGAWLSRVTEMALVVSLFITGLKLRLGFRNPAWRDAVRLAFPAMALTVAGVGAAVHFWLAQPWGFSLLVGALVAPTDPVLASIVAVDDARDADQMRAALSGEAGLNDGSALPFLMLALMLMASPGSLDFSMTMHWLLVDVLWSFAAGLTLGFGLGWIVGLLGTWLRTASKDLAPGDFLALALMALAYAGAGLLSASGFLAAFAAGLGLRSAELYVVTHHPHPHFTDAPGKGEIEQTHPPAEMLVNPNRREHRDVEQPAASVGLMVSDALSFGDTLERLIAFALVLLAGVVCARYWSLDGVILAGLLFVLIRPLSVGIALLGSAAPPARRLLIGWIGIRGIGTLNYLAYALTHGMNEAQSMLAAQLAITIVVLSVLVHGITAQPLMAWRRARMTARRQGSGDSNRRTTPTPP
ncbi:cation:proton antiporter [Rhodanobacter umsongensis]|uniref:Cation:proton antiporter n=1 Tax=Rhodanobacter umsongensis TaxID=633153 RepID=A0ABW0JGP6_9GAMM